MCSIFTNVTLVLPSADEISYLTFMSTMYNSPSPALQELAGFYRWRMRVGLHVLQHYCQQSQLHAARTSHQTAQSRRCTAN